jgi:hypothetical protein
VTKPFVEVLFIEDCPNYAAALALVERVAAELYVAPDIRVIEVRSPDEARALRFLGSPTIRVAGRDVEPGAERRRDFAIACRAYRAPRGLVGQPDEAWVREALEAAA